MIKKQTSAYDHVEGEEYLKFQLFHKVYTVETNTLNQTRD